MSTGPVDFGDAMLELEALEAAQREEWARAVASMAAYLAIPAPYMAEIAYARAKELEFRELLGLTATVLRELTVRLEVFHIEQSERRRQP